MAEAPHGTITLNDGRSMPRLGLGVWQTPAGEAARIMREAVAAGYRAVDTASAYNNEEGVGEGLAGTDVFLTTKLWNADQGYDATLRAFDASAARLGRPSVDLYLIHWPAPKKDLFVDSWKALVRLREEGRAGSIGVSNFNADHIARIVGETGVTPAVNQIELHPRFQQRALREVHERLGIATESWSPLGRGALLDDPALAEIARKHGKTAAQVVIRWHLDEGLIVIPKTVNPERLRENIDVWDFAVDGDDRARIAKLDSADGRTGPDPMTATF
ncbi:aldo/keto reductase [Lichenibacterium minor]|uniref:Aldo/keto reductase n=1 Tax=Lichenibacterium minor TaxID=2316528 RepID=A0A4Q2U691_9HYPH|nr:aldo/keto reductase [Lichenibacterium minor]RYC30601.1 aldo/keto reductase [Lichenibacterium minor]